MAAISAANTTATPSASCLTTLATVFATAVPTTKNAMKLKKAENHGAQRAGIALVATTVATELAASWKPLVKSNKSAKAITATIASSIQSMGPFLSALTRSTVPAARPVHEGLWYRSVQAVRTEPTTHASSDDHGKTCDGSDRDTHH